MALSLFCCDRAEGSKESSLRATTPLPKTIASLDASAQDLFVTGPLIGEVLPRDEKTRSKLEVTERLVARIEEMRQKKGLALSSAGRPG